MTPAPHGELTHPRYRPDIDGLRAVAVLIVVAFHAFPGRFRGGFVGVDVFFVISGFLITTIIVGSLGQQAFSFVEFYRRRVERIFPALLVVLISVLAAGWYLLLASEYAELGKHVTAGAGFLSNIVLYSESGYFDAAAESKPLLHLWSLGIEEQYYILWPAILYGAHLARWSLLRCAFALAVLSFAANCVALDAHRVATFYLPFTRFWELLVGSTLACAMAAHPQTCTRVLSRSRTGLSTVGAVLMVGSLVFIRPDFAFPGWWALAPTLGAAALIAAGPTGPINAMVLPALPVALAFAGFRTDILRRGSPRDRSIDRGRGLAGSRLGNDRAGRASATLWPAAFGKAYRPRALGHRRRRRRLGHLDQSGGS